MHRSFFRPSHDIHQARGPSSRLLDPPTRISTHGMSLSKPSPSVPTKVLPARRVKLTSYTDELLGEEKLERGEKRWRYAAFEPRTFFGFSGEAFHHRLATFIHRRRGRPSSTACSSAAALCLSQKAFHGVSACSARMLTSLPETGLQTV